MSTLPSEMPRLAEYDMAGQFCPADQTGGDTFDLVPLDDHRLCSCCSATRAATASARRSAPRR